MNARPLKVFTVRAYLGGNARGQVRAVVAAPTAAAAARACRVTPHRLRMYGSETGNPLQIEVAMSDPGAVFFCPCAVDGPDASSYTRWEPATQGEHS